MQRRWDNAASLLRPCRRPSPARVRLTSYVCYCLPYVITLAAQTFNVRLRLLEYLTYEIQRVDLLDGPVPPPPPRYNINLAALGKKRRHALAAGTDAESEPDISTLNDFSTGSAQSAVIGGAAEATSAARAEKFAAAVAEEEHRRQQLRELITREREAAVRTGKGPEPYEEGSPEAIFEQHVLKLMAEGHNCGNGPESIEGSEAFLELKAQREMAEVRGLD